MLNGADYAPNGNVNFMSSLNLEQFSTHLRQLNINLLFTDALGWNHPPASERAWQDAAAKDINYRHRMVAELSGVAVLEIAAEGGWPDEAQRMSIWRQVSQSHYENLLIFLDRADQPTQSLWYWVKRSKDSETGKPKTIPRRHEYFRGQPVDLFASKLQAMVVELYELDATGRMPVLEVARRMESALDVEKTTKRFFTAYQEEHKNLLAEIEGIDDERDRRWYASVILNRLMFVWFMQKKGFLDQADYDYLTKQFAASQVRGKDRFFGEFLNALFFEAFAKPKGDRTPAVQSLTGDIPYLNGGLFLHHTLELDANKQPRLGTTLRIPDHAFEGVFKLFTSFSWNLNDTPGGNADEINPDVLGYIFEKYINQKAFGAYYTRPEITNYLAERSIHKLILERIHAPAVPELGLKEICFASVPDMLAKMDNVTALKLVQQVLPAINILDPAVGSGAFLVAALKVLINVYSAVVGRAELGNSDALGFWLRKLKEEHPSVGYFIKRSIVTDNLYGVDIMQEATEIAKLRLFLTMVASVRKVEELEPLPNIDFNILPGNSLVGLMRVDEHEFDKRNSQGDLFKTSYRQLLEEKNRDLETYRHTADLMGRDVNLQYLRNKIDTKLTEATGTLNELLRDQFESLGVKYEQATWDAAKNSLGKPNKLKIVRHHIDEQTPFHWGYMFDQIMQKKGGFDIILANPPWEVFKPQAKEFFAEHSELVSKNKMTIKEFEKEQEKLLLNKEVRAAWLDYESRFPHISAYFRAAPEYSSQSAVVNGKKTGSDVNLYKLFTERCFSLLRTGGHCGIVVPGSIYTDLGATGLRKMLFEQASVEVLISLSNEKYIFEGVHHAQKFCFLAFEKGGTTKEFSATFRINPREAVQPKDLASFIYTDSNFVRLSTALIKRLSPDSQSVMEFRCELDVLIAEKMLHFPLLGEVIKGTWNVGFTAELHMTNDSKLFKTEPGEGRLPLYEGKMMWQFETGYAEPRFWVDEKKGRAALLGKTNDIGQKLEYQDYRLGFRAVAASTNERSLICTLLPAQVFTGNSLLTSTQPDRHDILLFIVAMMNSFVIDSAIRQKVSQNLNMFYIYQLPIPRLSPNAPAFAPIVTRAARLICTTPEFDDLAKEVGLKHHQPLEPLERAHLRAELDGLIAHLYGLTEAEFSHILTTFPIVAEPVKVATLNAYHDVERGLVK
jgi:hypothetical protein